MVRGVLTLVVMLLAGPVGAQTERCKERCEVERKKVARKLRECLEDVDPTPRDRAAKMRLLCRKRYTPPSCDGLPPCKAQQSKKAPAPYLKLGPVVFSTKRRGPALQNPRFPAGGELFLRLDAEVLPKPKASRVWLDLSLSLLAVDARGKTSEVVRWDSYAVEERPITPPERGQSQRFTLHGGAQLPADQKAGSYLMEALVKEKGSNFAQTTRGNFTVTAH